MLAKSDALIDIRILHKFAIMKKLLVLLLFLPFFTMGQESATYIFHSEDGMPFKVLLNGITQNQTAAPTVMVNSVAADAFKLRTKFIFEDEQIGEVKHQFSFQAGGPMVVTLTRSGATGMKVMSLGEMKDALEMYKDPLAVDYLGTVEIAETDDAPIETEVTLKISSTGTVSKVDPEPEKPWVVAGGGYEGPTGCDQLTTPEVADDMLSQMDRAGSDESRAKLLPGLVKGKCLTIEQIEAILLTYKDSAARLSAAKTLYPVLWDRGNVGQLKPLLSSKDWAVYMEFINNYGG
jgi:hypothetical protein